MNQQEGLTPMMVQYQAAKREAPGAVLMFRLGDFYEMFGPDAELAAPVLEITLTSREAGKGNRLAMCGVPHHAVDHYIGKLVGAGYSVALCDQTETARPGKLVSRTITSVITPGTFTDAERLDARVDNHLAAVTVVGGVAAAALLDLLGGGLKLVLGEGADPHRFYSELHRQSPRELVLDNEAAHTTVYQTLSREFQETCTLKPLGLTPGREAREVLLMRFSAEALEAWGIPRHSPQERALALLLEYLELNRITALGHAHVVQVISPSQTLRLEPRTIANLELVERLSDRRQEGSLLHTLDDTITPMGARLMRSWLLTPLMDIPKLTQRQDEIELFLKKGVNAAGLRERLKTIRDLSRLGGRVGMSLAGPKELVSLALSLRQFLLLRDDALKFVGEHLATLLKAPQGLEDAAALIERAIEPDPPSHTRDGGFIRTGFHPEIDELRGLASEGRAWISRMEEEERRRTGIKSLKVGYNKVFGYYLEITKANLAQAPPEYQRKQTLAGAERFVTPELKEMEMKLLQAQESLLPLEQGCYQELLEQLRQHQRALTQAAGATARLDVLLSLATCAKELGLTRPQLTQDAAMHLKGAFHPVVKASLPQGQYIPNDTHLGSEDGCLHIITGPNMGGKSTYMRQVALCQLMAQMGSFVAAKEAIVGLADAIHTRIGASDDVGQGLSTFMVEMVETSHILATATDRSLVLLDEVGRGTSTADGMAIARAVAEDLATRVRARTLFATHFHSLGDIAEQFCVVRNFHVSAEEKDQKMIFKRVLLKGATSRSFGIQVARLAGLPHPVIVRALELLVADEANAHAPAPPQAEDKPQMELFSPAVPHWLQAHLSALDLDALTPREALDLLFRWKAKLD